LDVVRWQTPVDLNFHLVTHEGSPVVTSRNNVLLPVIDDPSVPSRVEARRGSDGSLLWSQTTDYNNGPYGTFTPVLTPQNRLYIPAAGGTVLYCDNPDDPGATTDGRLAFYGIADHDPALDELVFISTPLTADADGTIYFGFSATPNSLGLRNGIARMDVNGNGTWISASDAAGDSNVGGVLPNCAPALSADGSMLYVAVVSPAYLVALDTTTLQPVARVALLDPQSGDPAATSGNSSATPMVGPDGDVYYGVLDRGGNQQRGWMLHFSADLSQTKIPGAFGWDTTPSVVPSSLVPSYTGPSSYLIVTKYNKYSEHIYQIGLLDPNVPMVDPYSNTTVMDEMETINGPTSGYEWCINDAAVDPYTGSVLANSEDGHLYRWDLASNTFTQNIRLNGGYAEAYTPTLIGPDGTVYSINGGILLAVQAMSPEASRSRSLTHGRPEARDLAAQSLSVFPMATSTPSVVAPSDHVRDRDFGSVPAEEAPSSEQLLAPPTPLVPCAPATDLEALHSLSLIADDVDIRFLSLVSAAW
jgi:hypothetical protein